jgi:hypothetical protein
LTRRDEIRARLEAAGKSANDHAEEMEFDPQVFVDDGWDPEVAAALADALPDLAWALGEIERLTEERDDAREALRVEREDRARTLAALRGCDRVLGLGAHSDGMRAAFHQAADLVERGGR